jgi:hypothetical protein
MHKKNIPYGREMFGMDGKTTKIALLVFLLGMTACGDEEGVEIKVSGYGALTYQMIGKGQTYEIRDNIIIQHQANPYMIGLVSIDGKYKERSEFTVSTFGQITYTAHHPQASSQYANNAPYHEIYLHHVEGRYIFFDPGKKLLQLGVGYFPYKYNPDARHLGEYLFRSGVYPEVIYTDFELALKRLLGLRLSSDLGNDLLGVHQDLLLTIEDFHYPYRDLEIGYVADIGALNKMITAGGGVQLVHFFSHQPGLVTPFYDPNENSLSYSQQQTTLIKYPAVDTLSGTIQDMDTTVYTFKGTKLMGRLAVDIKEAVPVLKELTCPDDARIYGEIALLGLADIGPYYPDLMKRMPIMFGLSVPTFKVLDILSLEFEYFNSDYFNSPYRVLYENFPIPNAPNPAYIKALPFKKSPWKWTVYAKKNLTALFYVSGMVGRDHFFLNYPMRKNTLDAIFNLGEVMPGDDHWQWILRAGLNF